MWADTTSDNVHHTLLYPHPSKTQNSCAAALPVEQPQRRPSGTFCSGSVPAARAEGQGGVVGAGAPGLRCCILRDGASLKSPDSRALSFPLYKDWLSLS